MNRTHSSGLAIAIGLVVFVATSVSGQAQRPSATMDDLLAEVRGLRADLTQMAGVSGRMQVLLVRLSLQEQRVATLGQQLVAAQRDLAGATQERQDTEAGLAQTEESIRRGTIPTERKKDVDYMAEDMRRLLAQREERERQLRAMEGEIQGLLTTEQGRWNEFNGRIDELERELPSLTP
jgi:chromosome segregation ATPase